ncbi:hypothetical protein BJF79_40730 [Actinomadura sp. CNU-125]|uniref:hypothetical protein n=1 Tax=Actinomadura sp. CNU-125 TaxID=1904961 RepID=UPI0009661A93|nr:hypothetical protein [Actinomadura sp. CNU-125]OLT29667.1 hypothetical protein BJF79_40730 [Actinomadura sp. CNU-125]
MLLAALSDFLDRSARAGSERARDPHAVVPAPWEWARELKSTVDDTWQGILDALHLWRPVSEHHIAPIALLAENRLAETIDPERGRRLLSTRRGGD